MQCSKWHNQRRKRDRLARRRLDRRCSWYWAWINSGELCGGLSELVQLRCQQPEDDFLVPKLVVVTRSVGAAAFDADVGEFSFQEIEQLGSLLLGETQVILASCGGHSTLRGWS